MAMRLQKSAKMDKARMDHQIWKAFEQNWREVFTEESHLRADPERVRLDNRSQTQGQVPGQTVRQAAEGYCQKG